MSAQLLCSVIHNQLSTWVLVNT